METTYVSGTDLSLNLGEIKISYDDAGRSEVPLIFIHGFPFNKSMWEHQVTMLSDHCRVIAYDIRGFGKSENGLQKFSIDLFADDLIDFMDNLQIKSAIVCGLSMGGYILLNAVNRFPDRFKAVIFSDTQCIADSEQAKEGRFKTKTLIENGGLKDFTEGFLPKVFSKDSVENKTAVVQQIRETMMSTDPTAIASTLVALAERNETCSILNTIQIPALIICGSEDVVTTPEQSRFLESKLPDAQLKMIDGAGHMSNLEQPEMFNDYVLEFIKSQM